MLTLDHISKTFNPGTINEKRALDGLSLHLKPGDFVTVIGGNGAGKSTMLNAVAGVWPVDDGRIILDGVDVTAMPCSSFTECCVGFVLCSSLPCRYGTSVTWM